MAESVTVDHGSVTKQVRRYWLSFTDPQRPKGQQFLGVAIVDVDNEDAADAKVDIDQKFPSHVDGAEWIAAASRKAWRTGCNPGGEMASMDITDAPPPEGGELPLHRLMPQSELRRLGLI
jgi:hypothetical protein